MRTDVVIERRERRRPGTLRRLAVRQVWNLMAVLLGASTLSGTALAADQSEFWPELNVFVRLKPATRLYFDAAYARGKDSFERALDAAAYLDISLKPIRRQILRHEDWARSRSLWARIGYDHVFKSTDGVASPSEDRGILSLWAKRQIPGDFWLEGRARTDLRWISGDYSTRYRFRVEATREFAVQGHPVVPYFNVEWFYDTRYSGWARTLYQVGPEVTVNKRFRFEVYLARQETHLPSASVLNALGVVAKWYY